VNLRKLSHLAVLVAVGCDGKLVVERDAPAGDLGTVDIGDNGGGGEATPISPNAGKLGESCLPAGLMTEAEGNSAHATVQTLTRCDAGLSCSAHGACLAAPDCQTNDGVCALRHAAITDNDAHAEVVALAANDSRVYWLEHGTYDRSTGSGTGDVYQHDGALLSYSIIDRKTTVVAEHLDGPIQLALTTTHAYITTYGERTPDDATQLVRVPLTGGSVQLIQRPQSFAGPIPFVFAAWDSQMFWTDGSAVYAMSADADAVPALLFEPDPESNGGISELASDGTNLLCLSPLGPDLRVMRITAAGEAPPVIAISPGSDLALHDDSMFVLKVAVKRTDTTPSQGMMLLRAPKSGGEFQQVRALGGGIQHVSLRVVGDRYFFEVGDRVTDRDGVEGPQQRVLTAKFTDFTPPLRLIEWPRTNERFQWTGTANSVYWTDGKTIYDQPLPAR
jgi:hypothetical protein